MRKHFETFEKQTTWAHSAGPKISVSVFGNSQWEVKWNNTAGFQGTQFPSYWFLLSVLASGSWVHSSSVSGYWVASFLVPGTRFPGYSLKIPPCTSFSLVLFLSLNFPSFEKLGNFCSSGRRELFVHNGWLCFLRSCLILWLTNTN